MELWELIARESCRDTLAQYNHAGDRFLLEEFAGAFCEDGVLEIRGNEPITGRAAIIERFGGPSTASKARQAARQLPADATRRVVRHNVTNIRFESLSPEEAVVSSYFTVFTEVGADHMGRYRDRFVPVGERWLIAHRFVSTDWRAPDSTFRGSGPL
jgi:SnoaL-like domain